MKIEVINYAGIHYIRCTPAKWMLNSNLVYDNIMAGHQFVVRLQDGLLTKLSGGDIVGEWEYTLPIEDNKQGDLFL